LLGPNGKWPVYDCTIMERITRHCVGQGALLEAAPCQAPHAIAAHFTNAVVAELVDAQR
jgi:hypothetical protein